MTQTHPLEQAQAVLLIGVGGFAGSNLRYLVETAVPSSLLATTTVNLLGCVALGVFLYEKLYTDTIPQSVRTMLATGFIGSFTTYSTFVVDALRTEPIVAVGYITGTYALGFVGVLLGREGARRLNNRLQSAPEASR